MDRKLGLFNDSVHEKAMKTAIIKRSIVIKGHKTSVSLENEFWEGLQEIAKHKSISLSALVELINHARDNNNLSSAIRVYVFSDLRGRLCSQTFESTEQVAHDVANEKPHLEIPLLFAHRANIAP